MRNQYFQLVFHDDQAYVHIYPAQDGGENLKINELTAYLDLKKFQGYDIKVLNEALSNEEETEVAIGAWDGYEVREMMEVDVSMDKMIAYARFYPASPGGQRMDAREIVGSLIRKRVKFGLNQQAIFDFLNKPVYCKDIIIAKGQPVRQGENAKIEYFFNTVKNLQPKRNEDGSVDYKDLNTISHVKEGDLLARLIKEDPGDPGKNVFGEIIKPRNVKTAKLGFGKNITINEDKTEIYTDVTGHAVLQNGKVFVSNVYTVPADVDNSTGNINYDGNVQINGNVKTGFTVEATGDVVINGVVENATVKAGGQIVVKSGIHGGGSGTLISETNVMSKYIENSTVKAGGYVEAEIIMGSDVSAADAVRAKGKKGLISGGTVRAKNVIEAENLGSNMGTPTMLEVGIEPEKKQRYLDLNKYIKEKTQELEDMQVIIANYGNLVKKGEHVPKDKLIYAQKLAEQYKEENAALLPLKEEIEAIHQEMLETDGSYVIVSQIAYPGVTIAISDISMNLKDNRSHTKFHKAEGEVKADIY
ncbi:MAG: DUF342 domain-containing protein [Agathobacter sp.]|uniref:DUF342 domain-containing protein n=1 Tax=Agathobacter sp. TaxID=2021311 RepID=UPI00257C6967|nr:FapA family protein [Agathobacter sp.]MBQ1682258.1 DUF342 domain-containing protein [Agathobacter sp.]